uniref:Abhydrolase_3 domain-containing protein n=1 Tax=Rhabditophanes sp. KR3021 TaxID=114890 RepID=A0AC35TI45_9BILA
MYVSDVLIFILLIGIILGFLIYFITKLLLTIGVLNGKRYFMLVAYFFIIKLPNILHHKDRNCAEDIRKRRSFKKAPQQKDLTTYAISTEIIGNCPCRIYKPKQKTNDLLFVFIHGGGWCILAPSDYDRLMDNFMLELNCTIVSIDYPLAPENVFPAAINECYNTIDTLMNSMEKIIGFNTTNCIIGGDSAGGCLTANMTQRAAMNDKAWFKHQILIYPSLISFNFNTPSYKNYFNTDIRSILSPKSTANCYLMYFGIETTEKNRNELLNSDSLIPDTLRRESPLHPFINNLEVSPILAEEALLKKLPSSITFLATADVLQDEGFKYHMNLKKAARDDTSICHDFHWIKNSSHGEVSFNKEAAFEMIKEIKYWLDKRGALAY